MQQICRNDLLDLSCAMCQMPFLFAVDYALHVYGMCLVDSCGHLSPLDHLGSHKRLSDCEIYLLYSFAPGVDAGVLKEENLTENQLVAG